MRIVVEPSDYVIRNTGDTAMLQIALERLAQLFPSGRIQVFTDDPACFPFRFPNVEPISTEGRRQWFDLLRTASIDQTLPAGRPISGRVARWLLRRRPSVALGMFERQGVIQPAEHRAIGAFLSAVCEADLLLVTGMGGVTDAFPDYAEELLEVVRLGQARGVRTAVLGQGIGPLEDARLRQLARVVLGQLDFIALREFRAGRPLCLALGVPVERILVTGDDAIELALRHQVPGPASGIGINMRAATYADVERDMLEPVRRAIQEAARRWNAPLVPIPISRVPGEEDAVTIRALLAGLDDDCDGGVALDTPKMLVEELSRCRVLVTGSYHAGVFALATGVPVVALVRSRYYEDKFHGLAAMFGVGCHVLRVDDSHLEQRLSEAMAVLWDSTDQLRSVLVAAAKRQVADSQAAFRRLTLIA